MEKSLEQSLKDMIVAVEYNLEGYKIRKDEKAVNAAEVMIAKFKAMLAQI